MLSQIAKKENRKEFGSDLSSIQSGQEQKKDFGSNPGFWFFSFFLRSHCLAQLQKPYDFKGIGSFLKVFYAQNSFSFQTLFPFNSFFFHFHRRAEKKNSVIFVIFFLSSTPILHFPETANKNKKLFTEHPVAPDRFRPSGAKMDLKGGWKRCTRMKKMKASQKSRKRGTTITLPPRLSKIEADCKKRIFAFSRESLETTPN